MLALTLTLVAQAQFKAPFARDVLETESGALYLMAPQWVAGPNVQEWSWSADGKTLAVAGADITNSLTAPVRPEEAESFVSVWSASTGKTLELARSKVSNGMIEWMGGNMLTFVTLEPLPSGPNRPEPLQRFTLRCWSPGEKQPKALWTEEFKSDAPEVTISPTLPYCVVRTVVPSGFQTWIVTPKGTAQRIEAPGGFIALERTGKLVIFESRKDPAGGDKPLRFWHRIEPNGRIETLAQRPELFERLGRDPDAKEARPDQAPGNVAFGKAEFKLTNGWLTALVGGQPKAALVAADARDVALSPDNRYVSYVSQSNLFVRKIRQLSPQEYQAMLDAAEKLHLMSNAKQLAVAMFIFAKDNSDRLPGKDGFLDRLSPYVKDTSVFQGFVFEMNGEDLSKVQDPMNQVLGYTQGKSGRAVVYADGHVKWIPNG